MNVYVVVVNDIRRGSCRNLLLVGRSSPVLVGYKGHDRTPS